MREAYDVTDNNGNDKPASARAMFLDLLLPKLERTNLLILMWLGSLGLPLMVFIVRWSMGYGGWITITHILTYGPLLLLFGILLASTTQALPKQTPHTRRLWLPLSGYLVWSLANLVGVGIVVSDLDDQEDLVGPFRNLIPAENAFDVAGVILAVGAAGVVFMFVAFHLERSVPFGKYCRSRPLRCSLEPRCQGLFASAKYTGSPVSFVSSACAESSLPRSQVKERRSCSGRWVIDFARASFMVNAPYPASAGPFFVGRICPYPAWRGRWTSIA